MSSTRQSDTVRRQQEKITQHGPEPHAKILATKEKAAPRTPLKSPGSTANVPVARYSPSPNSSRHVDRSAQRHRGSCDNQHEAPSSVTKPPGVSSGNGHSASLAVSDSARGTATRNQGVPYHDRKDDAIGTIVRQLPTLHIGDSLPPSDVMLQKAAQQKRLGASADKRGTDMIATCHGCGIAVATSQLTMHVRQSTKCGYTYLFRVMNLMRRMELLTWKLERLPEPDPNDENVSQQFDARWTEDPPSGQAGTTKRTRQSSTTKTSHPSSLAGHNPQQSVYEFGGSSSAGLPQLSPAQSTNRTDGGAKRIQSAMGGDPPEELPPNLQSGKRQRTVKEPFLCLCYVGEYVAQGRPEEHVGQKHFTTMSSMHRHVRAIHRKFICERCFTVFDSGQERTLHVDHAYDPCQKSCEEKNCRRRRRIFSAPYATCDHIRTAEDQWQSAYNVLYAPDKEQATLQGPIGATDIALDSFGNTDPLAFGDLQMREQQAEDHSGSTGTGTGVNLPLIPLEQLFGPETEAQLVQADRELSPRVAEAEQRLNNPQADVAKLKEDVRDITQEYRNRNNSTALMSTWQVLDTLRHPLTLPGSWLYEQMRIEAPDVVKHVEEVRQLTITAGSNPSQAPSQAPPPDSSRSHAPSHTSYQLGPEQSSAPRESGRRSGQ